MPSVPAESRKLAVFLCHGSEDKPAVLELHKRLLADGYQPWLDSVDILGGQRWAQAIPKAVRASDVILVCLSATSVSKEGYLQKEIRLVLDVADRKPDDTIFVIPVRLDVCDIPERLREWQWVDYSGGAGYDRIKISLEHRATEIGIRTAPVLPTGGLAVAGEQQRPPSVVGLRDGSAGIHDAVSVEIISEDDTVPPTGISSPTTPPVKLSVSTRLPSSYPVRPVAKIAWGAALVASVSLTGLTAFRHWKASDQFPSAHPAVLLPHRDLVTTTRKPTKADTTRSILGPSPDAGVVTPLKKLLSIVGSSGWDALSERSNRHVVGAAVPKPFSDAVVSRDVGPPYFEAAQSITLDAARQWMRRYQGSTMEAFNLSSPPNEIVKEDDHYITAKNTQISLTFGYRSGQSGQYVYLIVSPSSRQDPASAGPGVITQQDKGMKIGDSHEK